MNTPSLNTQIKNLLGVARSINEKTLVQSLGDLKSLMDKSAPTEEVQKSFHEIRKKIRDLYFLSPLFMSYPNSSEVWSPIFKEVYLLSDAWKKWQDASKDTPPPDSVKKSIDILNKHALTHQLQWFGRLTALALEKPESLMDALTGMWRYVALVSQMSFDQVVASKDRKPLIERLKGNQKDLLLAGQTFDVDQYSGVLLLAALKAMIQESIHPENYFLLAKHFLANDYSDSPIDAFLSLKKLGFGDLNDTLKLFKTADSLAEVMPIVEQIESDGIGLGKAIRLVYFAGLSKEDSLAYAKTVDLIQLVGAFMDDPESFARRNSYKAVEVISKNLEQVTKYFENYSDPQAKNLLQRLYYVPIKPTLIKYFTMCNEIANRLGKKIEFAVKGDDAMLSREHLQALQDALIHIIRNGLDHGIELPKQRVEASKPEAGALLLDCHETTQGVELLIRDDGKGIDPTMVCMRAVEKGVITAERAAKMTEDEKRSLIFEPNFSTKEDVTDISGRGVGLDAAKSNIEKMGGSITVKSEVGKGSEFRIFIPR